MRRLWRLMATAAAAALLLALVAGLRGRGRLRTIWAAPWGPGGVATSAAVDGVAYGPLAFAAAGTHVVIADSFARRLLLVPLTGGPARSVHLGAGPPLVEELSAADGGVVYFAGGGAIWRWLPGEGRPEEVVDLAASGTGPGLSLIEGLAALPEGEGVAVDLLTLDRHRATRSVFVLTPGGGRRPIARLTFDETAASAADLPAAVVPAGGRALAAGPDGTVYLLGFTRFGQRAVFRFGARGRMRAALGLPSTGGRWSLLGVDRAGRVYLGVNLGGAGGRIFALSRRGRVVLSRALPLAGGVRLGSYVAVAASGDLYVLDPRPESLRLMEWPLRRRLAGSAPPAVAAR